MAEAVRSLLPPDVELDGALRERLVSRAFSARKEPARPPRRRSFARAALVPAAAVVLLLAVLAAVLLPLFLKDGRGRPPKALYASARDVRGEVQLKEKGTGWRTIGSGAKIGREATLRTGKDSTTSLRFPDGSLMRVTDGSQAKVVSLQDGKIVVEHLSGETYHRVKTGTGYEVVNHDVVARAAGTAFNVDSRKPGHMEILCVENEIRVAISRHRPIEVAEGQVMTVWEEKRAEKAPVSRERLMDERLCASVRSDAEAGFSTGIYGELDVPLDVAARRGSAPDTPIRLNGSAGGRAVSLQWTSREDLSPSSLVLLRSELSEPVYPGSEIARYSDVSINSSSDDGVAPGRTYQYRVAALDSNGEVRGYSNTVVIPVRTASGRSVPVSIGLKAYDRGGMVILDWSVSGADKFGGFVLERTVQKAPAGSRTPEGSSSTRRIDSSSVFYTCTDDNVLPGHSYSYRVGLLVDGAVMSYSEPVGIVHQGQ